jgi:hypothetical protein
LLNKSDDSFDLHKLKFQLLSEIGKIQQEKNLLEAADATFISAEALRTKFLAETDIPPIEHVGLLKWQSDYEILIESFEDEQYYGVLAMAKSTAEEIEQLGDSAMTRNHRRLLMKLYDMRLLMNLCKRQYMMRRLKIFHLYMGLIVLPDCFLF